MEYKDFLKNKRVTVMGLGLLGRGLNDVKFLSKYCDEVLVTDLKSESDLQASVQEVKELPNVKLVLGEHRLQDFENRDFILKASGVPLNSEFIKHAKENNVPVYMDEALFIELAPKLQIIGVTGSRGKSSVTRMIYDVIKASGKPVHLGGNVKGVATLPLLETVNEGDLVVMELSSWQLQGFGDAGISPHISVFTNFYEDHLNYYDGDMDLYLKDKAKIYLNQKSEDFYLHGETAPSETGIDSKKIKVDENNLPSDWELSVPGEHNKINAGFAFEVSKIVGVEESVVRDTLENFNGVEGRLQFVKEVDGVQYYNDTTATSPIATKTAIEAMSLNGPVNIIMGGADKNLSPKELVDVVNEKTNKVILLPGSGTNLIKDSIKEYATVESMEEAVKLAKESSAPGDIVLLSPGFASFGLFKNEFDRGDQFNAQVNSL